MIYRYSDERPCPDIHADLKRLQGLVQDLERIHRGQHPDAAILGDAPVIHDWAIVRRQEACLAGTITGHPKIAHGHTGVTSGLWFLAPGLGYARTLSRFYNLGQPAGVPGIGRRLS